MKRQNLVLLSLFLFSITLSQLFAQNGMVASGGDASSTGGSIAYSIGQVGYSFISSNAGSVNPGLQQPYIVIMVGTDENDITITSSVYPNPVKNTLTLHVDDPQAILETKGLSYCLYDIEGRLLSEQKITSEETFVSMEGLAHEVYLICIKRNHRVFKTIKIFKSN